jgi:tRNA dimethylallyltransferase
MQKVLVILGPTASGKSNLAVMLAKKFNGEIISADSRQVYKGLNIGTGKISKKEMKGIPHYLLDNASPTSKKVFTVQDFKDQAEKAIQKILTKNKLPIICGGTGFYIKAVVDNISLPNVLANKKLRKKLEKKSTQELFTILKKLDPARAKNIDSKNPVRLIRAIEIATALGKVPSLEAQLPSNYKFLQIGIRTNPEQLKKKIKARLISRINTGMIQEAQKLHKQGLSWKRMEQLGLEYKYLAQYLQKKGPFDKAQGKQENKQELIEKLNLEIWHYAKRQMTWFKKDTRIKWFSIKDLNKIERGIKNFMKK